MLATLKNAIKNPELRKKLLFTLFIVLIYRLGGYIPVPFVDAAKLNIASQGNNIFAYLNVLSGGTFSKATLLCLSISPYINAQIIIQLLTFAIPWLEKKSKEGEAGRAWIDNLTKISTIVIAAFQGYAYFITLKNQGAVIYNTGLGLWVSGIVIVACFTAGAMLVIWLGSKIDKHGIGNGISILLFAGIVANMPQSFGATFIELANTGSIGYIILIPIVIIIFIVMIGFIIFMDNAERRIPIQYAKRVVGRKVYGGQSTYLPIKVAMAGVLPIIFAMSFMSLPQTIGMFIYGENLPTTGFWGGFFNLFGYTHPVYVILYFVLIIAFSYFYVSIQYNPVEIANNLRNNNGCIPGLRPGKPTSDYITRVLSKLILVGALFLGVIAVLPNIFAAATGVGSLALGGTSVLIVVNVALDTVRQIESQLMMRHHKGFLE